MDGFRVDITELKQSEAGFKKAGGELADVSRRLGTLLGKLAGQEFPDLINIMKLIESAAKLSKKSSAECLEYQKMCSEISVTYKTAEQEVLQMINALGSIGASGFVVPTAKSLGNVSSNSHAGLRAATPVIMSSDRLQGEKWLVKRAIDYSEERGVFD